RHAERRGAGPARNTAARVARGERGLILDSDNELLPDGGGAVRDAIARYGAPAGVIFLASISRSGRSMGAKSLPDGPVSYRDLLAGRIRGEWCTVVRVAALREFPYDEPSGG